MTKPKPPIIIETPTGARNQCMGCQAGWPMVVGFHREPSGGFVACTRSRYTVIR